jgi:hypothetical protein
MAGLYFLDGLLRALHNFPDEHAKKMAGLYFLDAIVKALHNFPDEHAKVKNSRNHRLCWIERERERDMMACMM